MVFAVDISILIIEAQCLREILSLTCEDTPIERKTVAQVCYVLMLRAEKNSVGRPRLYNSPPLYYKRIPIY